jgi:polysaccharide chain length determinant protein (PEP-CTERM system associated)
MLPGKKYQPEDYLRIAWTRKWFIVIPAVLIAAGTYVWSSTLPNRYSSSTNILVIPQRIPQSMVRSTVTASVAERLRTIQQEILSRSRLERIIEEFNLYQQERKTMIMEDVVQLMRTRDIKTRIPRARRGSDTTNFTVGFESTQPRVAMQVAERLASMFVQENLQEREVLADSTSQFLQAQLEDSRRRLVEHETKLEAFRRQNFGQLPGQVQSNLQMLQVTQTRLQANVDAVARERDRLRALEEAIASAPGSDEPLGVPVVADAAPRGKEAKEEAEGPSGSAAQQLEKARANLRDMERRFKPTHPDIPRAKRMIADLEAQAAEEAERAPAASLTKRSLNKLADMRDEAEQLRKQLEKRKIEEERLKADSAKYTARVEASPRLEAEHTALTRDYNTLEAQYTSFLKRYEASKVAVNLERRQIGEQFKIIDGARLPERPVSPDRVRHNLMGLLAGLVLGLGLVALLEYRDTTLKTDNDIVISLALPVLAVIPAMLSTADRRRRRRKRLVLALSASAATVAAAAVVAWRLQLLQAWVR